MVEVKGFFTHIDISKLSEDHIKLCEEELTKTIL